MHGCLNKVISVHPLVFVFSAYNRFRHPVYCKCIDTIRISATHVARTEDFIPRTMGAQSFSKHDTYVLARDFKSASRLNYEHYLWHETVGYDLHPEILATLPSSVDQASVKIADVACGTAIWLRRVAQQLPHAHLDGYDINLAQCPPIQWLPKNVRLREWDLFNEPSEEMLGAYDVVHVRLLFVVVRDSDPRPIIRNLKRLLRPKGRLQWDELNVSKSLILRAEEGIEAPVMEAKLEFLEKMGKWVAELAKCMEECGFEGSKLWEVPEREDLAKAFFDNHLAKDEEMAEKSLDREMLLEQNRVMCEESRCGVVLCTPKVVCTARKGLEENGVAVV